MKNIENTWESIIENRFVRVQENGDLNQNLAPKNSISPHKATRTEYERDFDRLIFSAAFKRLQNKTQVFPLPGTIPVHNRLTHSLEVASVGRSLGSMIGNRLAQELEKNNPPNKEVIDFYRYKLKDVILAACLAHDLGNPCFGHSGEKIISDYFSNLQTKKNDLPPVFEELKDITDLEWNDLTNFEGNANTLRILTTHYHGKLAGGLRLTYLTLATILKYPWDSSSLSQSKKYGFFQEQKELVKNIVEKFSMGDTKSNNCLFKRHPFVYLVEAADDICYLIMDIEDAHKINILSHEEVEKILSNLIKEIQEKFISKHEYLDNLDLDNIKKKLNTILDKNEKIVYLRSKCINVLTLSMVEIFIEKSKQILTGNPSNDIKSLKEFLIEDYGIGKLQEIITLSQEKIYQHHTISETMVGASRILPELLNLFIPSILKQTKERTYQQKKIFSLITPQYTGKNFESFIEEKSSYSRILCLLDFLTGMTDNYILELYRKLIGIDMPKHH